MSVTRPVVKIETLKKTKIKPAWVLASPWKVANQKGETFTWDLGKLKCTVVRAGGS